MNWAQLRTVFWLRWRLNCNQWQRSGGLSAVLSALIMAGAILLALASFATAFLSVRYGFENPTPRLVMTVWSVATVVFVFFWMIGLIVDLNRSETIGLQRLMHLPVGLGQIFLVNYLASHFTLTIVVAAPAFLGLILAFTVHRGPLMLLLLPLVCAMVLMVTAWTYCLRGWLAVLMTNPRRRRTVIVGTTLAFVLLAQAPNLYFSLLNRSERGNDSTPADQEEARRKRHAHREIRKETFQKLVVAQKYIPPLWVPVGAQALAEGRVLPAIFGALGCLVIGGLGLGRAYKSTLHYYQGGTGEKRSTSPKLTVSALPATATRTNRSAFVELRFRYLPEQAVAVGLAAFRSMLRAPEIKMAWATPILVVSILGASLLLRASPRLPALTKPFIVTSAMAVALFTLVQFLGNQFGMDRHGFRALILSPADRRFIVLGKNLASLPIMIATGLLLLGLTSFWLRLPVVAVVAAFFQLTAMVILATMGGNLLSILMPYRVESGSMKPTKMPTVAMFVMFLCQMLFPLAMAPAFMPPLAELLWRVAGGPHGVPVNLIFSIALAALAGIAYWQTLRLFGELLRSREMKILETVSVAVE